MFGPELIIVLFVLAIISSPFILVFWLINRYNNKNKGA